MVIYMLKTLKLMRATRAIGSVLIVKILFAMSGASYAGDISGSGYSGSTERDYRNGLIIKTHIPIKYLKAKYPNSCPEKSEYCEIKKQAISDCPRMTACSAMVFIKNGTKAVPFEITFNKEDWWRIFSKTEDLYGKVTKRSLGFPPEIQAYARRNWGTELYRDEYEFKTDDGVLVFSETQGVDLLGGTNKPIKSWTIVINP
jgi:hypothetical protein